MYPKKKKTYFDIVAPQRSSINKLARSREIPRNNRQRISTSSNLSRSSYRNNYKYTSQPINNRRINRPFNQKKSHKKRNILLVLSIIIILGGSGVIFYGWFVNHLLKRIDVSGFSTSVGGAENILIAGSTTRCGLKFQNAQWGFCSQGVTGVNSDIIMIVHLVPKTRQVTLLSIPRDTFVPNARAGGLSFKIDAALYEGPSQLVKAIEEDFGIPIQHYAELNFDGFVNVVNALGGIRMDFPMPVYDAYSHLDIKVPGCTELTGLTALQLIRARHLQYKPPSITTNNTYYWPYENQSDIGRIARTHEFLRVLASSVQKRGLSNPITDEKLISSILPNVTVDSGFNDSTILGLIEDFHHANLVNAPQYTLPIAVTPFGNYYFEGENFGDVVFPVEPTDQNIINKFLGSSNNTNTMTGKPLPPANTISVSVMNGSGVSGQASIIANGLKNLGYNIYKVGTDKPKSIQAQETVVYYTAGHEAQAESVARQLSGYVVMSINPKDIVNGSEVTVLTGTAASVNEASTTLATSSSSPSTSSTSQTSSNGSVTSSAPSDGFSAPSQPNEGLTPWDPRACTN